MISRIRALGAMLAMLGLGIVATEVSATAVVISGGGSSNWLIDDSVSTTNGLPAGGSATSSGGNGSGFAIQDASIPGQVDAFDSASMVWINNNQVNGTLSQSGQIVTHSPETIGGLTAQIQYRIDTTDPITRTLVTITNPGSSAISVHLDWANNSGADGAFAIQGTSSGDTTFTTADRWVVVDDGSTTSGDPATTFVLYGSDGLSPSSVGTTVFSSAGTEGILAGFDFMIGADTTTRLMFFNELNSSSANALAAAGRYNTLDSDDPLLSDLSDAQLASIINWDFDIQQAPLPEPSSWALIALGLVGMGFSRRRLIGIPTASLGFSRRKRSS